MKRYVVALTLLLVAILAVDARARVKGGQVPQFDNRNRRLLAVRLAAVLAFAALLTSLLGVVVQGGHLVNAIGASPRVALDEDLPTASVTATLLVGTNAAYWPMEYISDSQIVGHDIDLMNAVAAKLGVTAVYIDVPWEAVLEGLIAGQYDAVIASLGVGPGREAVIDFTLPYAMFRGEENIAIAVQQGNHDLRHRMNLALRELRADGTLATIIAAIGADMPEWEPQLPDWHFVYLPSVVRASD